MRAFQRRSLVIGLLLLACGQAAFGGKSAFDSKYTDPSGFSFTYPEGWFPLTQAALGDAKQMLPPELKDWVSNNRVNFDQIAVFLVRDGRDEFLESVNVVVDAQRPPVNEAAVKQLTATLAQQYRALGVKIESLTGRVQRFGSRDAAVLEYQSQIPGVDVPLRQKQVLFPSRGKSYIVTCTATVDSYEKYQPTFDAVLASFESPPPIAQGFDWNRISGTAIVGGVIGGMVGSLVAIARKFLSKPSSKQKNADTPEAGEL